MTLNDPVRNTLSVGGGDADDSVFLPVSDVHAGALALGVGAKVRLNLAYGSDRGSYVHITPSPEADRNIHLRILLRRNAGALDRLLGALHEADVDIINLSSDSLRSDVDRVELLAELSRTTWSGDSVPIWPSDRYRYRRLASRFDTTDGRQIRLYEILAQHCATDLWYEHAHGTRLPAIYVESYSRRSKSKQVAPALILAARDLGTEVLQRNHLRPEAVLIPLPRDLVREIRQETGQRVGELSYLSSADPRSRTHTVLFLRAETVPRLLPIAFQGKNLPGMVKLASGLLLNLSFTPLMSRQFTELDGGGDETHSIWEVIAEGAPDDVKAPLETFDQRREAVAKRLSMLVKQNRELRDDCNRYALTILPPRLRSLEDLSEDQADPISLSEDTPRGGSQPHNRPPRPTKFGVPLSPWSKRDYEEARRRIRRDWKGVRDEERLDPALGDLAAVHAASSKSKPRIFLSYPHEAERFATILKAQRDLKAAFEFSEYQLPGANYKKTAAIEYIMQADFVIVFWHPKDENDGKSISPWLAFEYAAAETTGRPTHHLVHKRADPFYTVRRINGNYTPFPYYRPEEFAKVPLHRHDNRDGLCEVILDQWQSPPRMP